MTGNDNKKNDVAILRVVSEDGFYWADEDCAHSQWLIDEGFCVRGQVHLNMPCSKLELVPGLKVVFPGTLGWIKNQFNSEN